MRAALEHNLKNVDVDIPRDALVVFTGVSGSGKSSLAFGTLYAEAQRRCLESVVRPARSTDADPAAGDDRLPARAARGGRCVAGVGRSEFGGVPASVHVGATGAFGAYVAVLPERDLAVATVVNSGHSDAGTTARTLLQSLIQDPLR